MTDEKEGLLIDSESYVSYLKWRTRFILKLALFHFSLIIVFDVLAIFAPSIFSRAAWQGSAFTIGIVYALAIVFSVIASTFYYSRRINQHESNFTKNVNQLNETST